MKVKTIFLATTASLLCATAWAQSAPKKLDLNLPASQLSQATANATPVNKPAVETATTNPDSAVAKALPTQAAQANAGIVSISNDNAIVDAADSRRPACNNDKYSQPQVHGSLGVGVMAGNHVSGNYQTGNVSVTKALGTCDHPTGEVGLSISISQGNFNNRGYRGGRW